MAADDGTVAWATGAGAGVEDGVVLLAVAGAFAVVPTASGPRAAIGAMEGAGACPRARTGDPSPTPGVNASACLADGLTSASVGVMRWTGASTARA